MARMIRKSFTAPEETRPIDKGKIEIVNLGDVTAMRATFQPGWRWSECLKSIAGTESCQVAHMGYVISGRMRVRMDDGTEDEFGPGDVGVIPAGHDAWIVGNEPMVFIDFQGGGTYAKPQR
jgi:ethanolamine utilization protein EutQ (cupin superfamily)